MGTIFIRRPNIRRPNIRIQVALACTEPIGQADAVVVIDVLRATTVVVAALANGAAGIIPVRGIEEARSIANAQGGMLGGEFENKRIDGFDLGNSPLEYTREAISGRRIVLRTTNGTRAIAAVEHSGARVLCAALVNVAAVANHVVQQRYRSIVLLCAGQDGRFSLEDFACAGAIVRAIMNIDPHVEADDAGLAARLLFDRERSNLAGLLAVGNHARDLQALAGDADLAFAARLDAFDVVPELCERMLIIR
ncbi:MAG: 2-phosphosulfolactate phosphatase [Vulcanimicrobiaceae bacterium]